jgi:hypothetical protein
MVQLTKDVLTSLAGFQSAASSCLRWIIFLQKKPYEITSDCEQFIYALKGGDFLLIRLSKEGIKYPLQIVR